VSDPRHVAIIVNPVSGASGGRGGARERVEQATALAARLGIEAHVSVTEHRGHARALAKAASANGASLVVAWGGDGTINEVGAALAFGETPMAVVPAGSGNGLARELGVPRDAEAALVVARGGGDRAIDVGELDGRLFFNVAGLGLDASVARRVATVGGRRGLYRYVVATLSELLTYAPSDHEIVIDGVVTHVSPLVIALANSRQYGSGAFIAPRARLDDGRLEVVVIAWHPLWRTLLGLPSLFTGGIDACSGVTTQTVASLTVRGVAPLQYHVDGEPCVGGSTLVARTHPGALKLRVPSLL